MRTVNGGKDCGETEVSVKKPVSYIISGIGKITANKSKIR